MTQDNAFAYSAFSVIGGHDYEGESARTMRLLGSHEAAVEYACELLDEGFDHAYVIGVLPDGSYDLAHTSRIAGDEPSDVNLAM